MGIDRIVVADISPSVDAGGWPAKRSQDEELLVEATIRSGRWVPRRVPQQPVEEPEGDQTKPTQ
jgi:Domain of unknown function (DUF3416)